MNINIENIVKEERDYGQRYSFSASFGSFKPEVYFAEHRNVDGIEVWNIDELLGQRLRKLSSSVDDYSASMAYLSERLSHA